jgi:hypothetical protein
MMNIARSLALAAGLAACTSLSAADTVSNRPVSGFTAIGLSAPVKLELVQGDTESLVLEGDEALIADIETVVEDKTLKIRHKSKFNFTWGSGKVHGRVVARNIEALKIAGAGDITAAALKSSALKLAISGSGDIKIGAVTATNLDVAVSGSGDVTLGGTADELSGHIAGSGDLRLALLQAKDAKISIAGSGDATLWATQSLAVSVAGSGDVRYYGDPSIKKTSIVGSGSLKRMGGSPS